MEIRKVDWDTVHFQWKWNLWPGRYGIKAMSSMMYNDPTGYDLSIYEKYEPTFWGVYDGQTVVGVNTGFRTEDTLYRSRGIYVDDSYRGQGVAQLLFASLEEQAHSEGCDWMWSYPREGSHYAYLKFGFEMVSEWRNDSFGRNAYVLKNI